MLMIGENFAAEVSEYITDLISFNKFGFAFDSMSISLGLKKNDNYADMQTYLDHRRGKRMKRRREECLQPRLQRSFRPPGNVDGTHRRARPSSKGSINSA